VSHLTNLRHELASVAAGLRTSVDVLQHRPEQAASALKLMVVTETKLLTVIAELEKAIAVKEQDHAI